ncbi:hypothetical protein ND861_13055 [Leptospira sp. 2 VSF19]|uniref:Cupin domain protein n=1 Tax=Leptospira soteropolitanensis TaxID=2950025 RepID=A0AAW5VF70_9LEPT|nr:hypothetical protein [Leptospira soteropolitanensis]MCW7493571.1 hypothetical protein [Leptospira soteropolitanensis]MCW7501170.1 hypothetical protein [Leptospira soteropolitanensis]MCW7523644.1 hypothetical protein [Leptospira soteropolitanensis]MCW7527283.1 hypothetical protein [Leptospira soteropolitanensis]MCW7531140.1 hypothetical protein [Leptospira soteropolitanensis]
MAKKFIYCFVFGVTYLFCKPTPAVDSKDFVGNPEIRTISLSEFQSNTKSAADLENVETQIANLGSFTSSVAVAKSRTVFKEKTNRSLVPRAIYILSGSGKIHFDDAELPIKENDWLHFPPANAIDIEPTKGKVLKFLIFHGYWTNNQ